MPCLPGHVSLTSFGPKLPLVSAYCHVQTLDTSHIRTHTNNLASMCQSCMFLYDKEGLFCPLFI